MKMTEDAIWKNKTQHYHPLKYKEADEISPCRGQNLAETRLRG